MGSYQVTRYDINRENLLDFNAGDLGDWAVKLVGS
jgi:hypothetical protein